MDSESVNLGPNPSPVTQNMSTYAERVTQLINKISNLRPDLRPQATDFVRGCSRLEPKLGSLAKMEQTTASENGLVGLAMVIANIQAPYDAYVKLEQTGRARIQYGDQQFVATNPPELVEALPWGGEIHLGPHHHGPSGVTFVGMDQRFVLKTNQGVNSINGIEITRANLKPIE